MDFITYLASTRVGGWVDMAVLGAAGGVLMGLIVVLGKACMAVHKQLKEKKRRGRLALLATVAAASIALSLSWYGMNLYFEEVMGFTNEIARFALCGFIELMLIASALRSRDWRLLKASRLKEIDSKLKALPADGEGRDELVQEKTNLEAMKRDVDGRAMWMFALLAGLMSALKVHDLVAVPPWLLAPLIATWGWERAMTAEALEITVRQATRLWVEDLKALWHRFLVFCKIRKPTSLNANEQAQEQQINKMVDFAFRLKGMNDLLAIAKQEAETQTNEKQRNKALRHVAALTEDRLKIIKSLHKAALTLMEMRMWTPKVAAEIDIRLDAMFNLEHLADPQIVAERARTSLDARTVAHPDADNDLDDENGEDHDSFTLGWTDEIEAFRDGDDFADAPISPAGPAPITTQNSMDAQSMSERPDSVSADRSPLTAQPLAERPRASAPALTAHRAVSAQPLSERPGSSAQPLTAHRPVSAVPLNERQEVSASALSEQGEVSTTAVETERPSERSAPVEVSVEGDGLAEVGGVKVVPLKVEGVPNGVAAGWIALRLANGATEFGPEVAEIFGKGQSTGRRWVKTISARPDLQKEELELLAQLVG